MSCSRCNPDPIVETHELTVEDRPLVPGVRVRITNVPVIVRTGGHEPGIRRYYTMATWAQLDYLRELARLRIPPGQDEVVLDFGEDAALGREAYNARRREMRERSRKWYHRRMRRVPRFGSSDYYYERLQPAGLESGEGQNVSG
jgi:hypothetical protein